MRKQKWRESDTRCSSDVLAENEKPGALAGATGSIQEAGLLHDERYAETDRLGSVPLSGDWNRARWDWLRALLRTPNLPPIASKLATVLVTEAADHDTAECLWHNETFADAMAVCERTVKCAFKALATAGWLVRSEGRGRGNSMLSLRVV